MPKITYIEHDETTHVVDLNVGLSVMQGAVNNNIPGIDADCGGLCACATCHVFIDAAWMDKMPPAAEDETGMLNIADGTTLNSRLACQIEITQALDGLVVHLPDGQH